MERMGMMRICAVALGLTIALAALASAAAQQEPPHRFYGLDATSGDMIAVHDADGTELGSATVAADGSWYIDVDRDASDDVSFTVNGDAAEAEITRTGSGQSAVTLTMAMMDDDAMMSEDGDSMMGEDDDSMMGEDDDSMMHEDGDSMMEGEDAVGLPATGTGGLADGGFSAGLIGLLIALGAVTLATLSYRRARNRA